MQFVNCASLSRYLVEKLNISTDEGWYLAVHLIHTLEILWDSGYRAYFWPDSLSIEDVWEHLEIVREREADFVDTCPF
jgi:hypothetical protein